MQNSVIRQHLTESSAKHIIFIVVATPVEEVGRDHDFDWAVVEPSSYRSFIQLAGRVLRHRNKIITQPNLALMQQNLRALRNKKVAFCYPGYESLNDNNKRQLLTHDLAQLIDIENLAERIDAQARISRPSTLQSTKRLADLEHYCIEQWLNNPNQEGPESLTGWLHSHWWLTGQPQIYTRFRNSNPQAVRYLIPDDRFADEWRFVEKDQKGSFVRNESDITNYEHELTEKELKRLWLYRDYTQLLLELDEGDVLEKLALIYGEFSLPIYGENASDLHFTYSNQLGLSRR